MREQHCADLHKGRDRRNSQFLELISRRIKKEKNSKMGFATTVPQKTQKSVNQAIHVIGTLSGPHPPTPRLRLSLFPSYKEMAKTEKKF